jgi:hypothetical protein
MRIHAGRVALAIAGLLGVVAWAEAARPAARFQPKVAFLAYDVPAGTDAGANPGGVWTTRPLNTEVYDPGQLVTLSANQFTLKEGTYLVDANQTIMGAHGIPKGFRGRLRNVTANTTVALSLNVRLHEELNESAAIDCPIGPVLLDLEHPATFELQFYCESEDGNTWALGLNLAGSGEAERYASVFIQKID